MTPAKLSTLDFKDKFSTNQKLVLPITVKGPSNVSLEYNDRPTVSNGEFRTQIKPYEADTKLPAGTYIVEYRTKLKDDAAAYLDEEYVLSQDVTNDSDWIVNGDITVDGPETSFKPYKKYPPVGNLTKTVTGADGQGNVNWGDTLHYEITLGTPGVRMGATTVTDTMSMLQKLVGDVHITDGNGNPVNDGHGHIGTIPAATWDYADSNRQLFQYEVPAGTYGVVTITYDTKVLSEADMKNLNIYGGNPKQSQNKVSISGSSATTTVNVPVPDSVPVVKKVTNQGGTDTSCKRQK